MDATEVIPSISTTTFKNFSEIVHEYDFFRQHSSEYEVILELLSERISAAQFRRPGLSILDFGGGDGRLLRDLYHDTHLRNLRPKFSVIEPADAYREQASFALSQLGLSNLNIAPKFTSDPTPAYHLIVSNHVMYYIPDLDSCLSDLWNRLRPGGELWLIMANPDNALVQLSEQLFSYLDKPYPYRSLLEVTDALEAQGLAFDTTVVNSLMSCQDTEQNRERLIKFILGDFAPFAGAAKYLTNQLDHLVEDGCVMAPLSDTVIRLRK